MKYIIITYIALGLVLSSAVGVAYYCSGQDMLPEYYGSPFIFQQRSLGSSLTYYYSVTGLILNTIIWSMVVWLLRIAILHLIKQTGNNPVSQKLYRGIVILLIVFTTLNVASAYLMLGSGFEKGLNYWYMDLDKEAKRWGMECEGKWGLFP